MLTNVKSQPTVELNIELILIVIDGSFLLNEVSIKDQGVTFDPILSFNDHINTICQKA